MTEVKRKKKSKKKMFGVPVAIQRKLVKIGDTYYGQVPTEFVKYHELKEGDPIYIKANRRVTIVPIKEKEVEKLHEEFESSQK